MVLIKEEEEEEEAVFVSLMKTFYEEMNAHEKQRDVLRCHPHGAVNEYSMA